MYHLLLVDDESIILNSYYKTLSDTFQGELSVDKCQHTSQILPKMAERIDILVTDIYMPKLTGFDVNELVHDKWKNCQTIFITGSESIGCAQKAIRDSKNVIDYVLKLEEEEVLLNAVRKAIRELDKTDWRDAEPAEGTLGIEVPEIAMAIQYIDTHISNDLSLTKISAMVFLSPSYFSKLFKQSVGIGFNEYVTKLRMSHAQSLLRTTSKKVGDISKQVGFESAPYFNRMFKSLFGCTPQEFRKQSIVLM